MTQARINRRRASATLLALACAPAFSTAATAPIAVEVWKDPECGCCKDWVAHLEAHGFKTKLHETGYDAARERLGVANKYGACHTGLVGGYALEGHVPASEIKRLLKEKPVAVGLAVPGMPVGAPGMDGAAYGGLKTAFDVLLLAKDGSAKVYQHYEGNKR
jgi:hypothetical protein